MKLFNNHSGLRGLPRFTEGIYWATGLSLTTPFTEGYRCAGADNKASPPGRHQEQVSKQRCTFSPTTFSSVQFSLGGMHVQHSLQDQHRAAACNMRPPKTNALSIAVRIASTVHGLQPTHALFSVLSSTTENSVMRQPLTWARHVWSVVCPWANHMPS